MGLLSRSDFKSLCIFARQIYIEQRERDRVSRIAKFAHANTKFHCADLFDMETHILDLADHVRHLVPNLAPLVGQPLLNVTDLELRVDASRTYEEKQLVPMIGMVWKLARFIDDRIHVQQAAGACSVGYVQYYQYKNTQVFGNERFSGSKADKEFWTHDTFDTEREILKMQAHHKLVASAGGQLPKVLLGSNTAQKNNYLLTPLPPKPLVTESNVRRTTSAGKLRQLSSQGQLSRLPLLRQQPLQLKRIILNFLIGFLVGCCAWLLTLGGNVPTGVFFFKISI